jgi:outer membrane murein-binding lipoprotein Lpp
MKTIQKIIFSLLLFFIILSLNWCSLNWNDEKTEKINELNKEIDNLNAKISELQEKKDEDNLSAQKEEEKKQNMEKCLIDSHNKFIEEGKSLCLEIWYSEEDINNLKCRLPNDTLKHIEEKQAKAQEFCLKLYK